MVNKKGISTLVATVLLVVITIAAVGIVYVTVMPLIREGVQSSATCSSVGLEVKTYTGYTCYSDTEVKIQVGRSAEEATLKSIQLQINGQGISKNFVVNGTADPMIRQSNALSYNTPLTLPGKNEVMTYVILRTAPGMPTSFDTVSAAPVVTIGATTTTCNMPTPVEIQKCA